MINNLKKFGPLFIFIAALLWSVDGLLRVSLYSLPPDVVVFWEHVLGAIVLLPMLFVKKDEITSLDKKEWKALLLLSLFSGALGTMFYTAALGKVGYIQFSVVPLLQQLQPLWAISAAAYLLKEKLNKQFLVWAGFAIVSTYFITFKDLSINFQTDQNTMLAGAYALLAGAMWGTTTSLSKIVLKKVSFITASMLRFVTVPFFAILIIAFMGNLGSLFALETSQWMGLLAITFSTGMIALLIYYYGLKRTPARVSTIVELTWPASAILIDYFYFGNSLSLTQIFGVGLLALSMYKVIQFRK